MSPFRVNYGFEPRMTLLPKGIEPQAQKATIMTQELSRIHQELQKDLQFLSSRSAIYYNRKRLGGPIISEGDRVYLLRRNFKTNRPSDKLDYTKLGPFLVKERKGDVNYLLDLPQPTRKHPVFHISLLEKADPSTNLRTAPLRLDEDDEEYDVEEILDYQQIDREWRYLVKWLDYDPLENTWELPSALNCPEKLAEFRARNPAPLESRLGFGPRSPRRRRR